MRVLLLEREWSLNEARERPYRPSRGQLLLPGATPRTKTAFSRPWRARIGGADTHTRAARLASSPANPHSAVWESGVPTLSLIGRLCLLGGLRKMTLQILRPGIASTCRYAASHPSKLAF